MDINANDLAEPVANAATGVETHFNRKYREFDSFYDEKKSFGARMIDRFFRRSMRLRFERVVAGVAPYENKTVLDVGCGAGRYALVLAGLGIKKVVGIDFAENMILAAQQMAKQSKLEKITEFKRLDFMQLPILEPFDHVYAMGVMDYIATPAPFMEKMVRSAAVSVMLSFPSAGGFIQWCRKHYFFKIKKCPVYFYTSERINQLLTEIGVSRYTLSRLAKDYFLEIHLQ